MIFEARTFLSLKTMMTINNMPMIPRAIATIVVFAFVVVPAAAQNGSMYGSISDKQSGEMLVGANISIPGSSMGVVGC